MRPLLLDRAIALAVPPVCACCRRDCEPRERICARCADELRGMPRGEVIPLAGIDDALAAFPYSGPARSIVMSLKFAGATALAETMAELMCERLPDWDEGVEWIVPAPAHPQRRRQRGFNQSLLLARALAAQSNTLVVDCLVRDGAARPQSELTRAGRLAMPPTSIKVDLRALRRAGAKSLAEIPTNVAVCDDVVTTGVTLEVCAHAISERQSGGSHRSIRSVTFASASTTRA
jgi:predicted amidophosphoribosyltransferase